MLANVFTKTIYDRWKGVTIGALGLVAMLLLGMVAYRGVDLTVYTEMPEAMRALMNIGDEVDAGVLAYNAIYGSYGALTMAAITLAMGAASIAGEERNGTIGMLLANPQSRTRIVLSKAASLVALSALATLVLWGAGFAVPRMIDLDVSRLHIGALMLHLFVVTVFFGFLAIAIGAWTGNKGKASGISAGILVLSWFAVGLLPLIEGWEQVAKVFPWYYYTAGRPVDTGVHWGHLGVLAGGIAALGGIAVIGVNRRDLKERGVARTLLDRLRANPMTEKVVERIAGSARVSGITAKTVSDHQILTFVVGYIALIIGAIMGPFYLLIDEPLKKFAEQIPEGLLAVIGYADMGTPEGWYQTENFSFTIPIALIVVTVIIGAKALAGEEAQRTMGLLLANPVSRTRIVVAKTVAMLSIATVLGVLTFGGTMLGSLMAGLGMSVVGVASVSTLATLLALVFGSLALAISAATGSVRIASFGSAGAAFVLFVMNAFLPLNDSLANGARVSPFFYYLTNDPLNNGMPWGDVAVLAAIIAVAVGASVVLFDRRDLRQVG